jgi:hypothetical protein
MITYAAPFLNPRLCKTASATGRFLVQWSPTECVSPVVIRCKSNPLHLQEIGREFPNNKGRKKRDRLRKTLIHNRTEIYMTNFRLKRELAHNSYWRAETSTCMKLDLCYVFILLCTGPVNVLSNSTHFPTPSEHAALLWFSFNFITQSRSLIASFWRREMGNSQ